MNGVAVRVCLLVMGRRWLHAGLCLSTASASGNDVAIGNPMPAVSPSEFTSV